MCKVSVVIPYYNNESTIIRALKSIVDQSYCDYEIILIDDGSEDDSFNLVEDFIMQYPKLNIKNIYQENQGPSVARNKGIIESKGEYIAFLDADDTWEEDKLRKQVEIMDKKNIYLLGCNFNVVIGNETVRKYFVKEDLKRIGFKRLLFKHYYATPCVIVRRNALLECGMFEEKQKYMEDALLFTEIAREFNAYMTNEFLVNTYKKPYGDIGLSGNLNEMEKYELLNFKKFRREKKISLFLYIVILINSILKFVLRKIIIRLR